MGNTGLGQVGNVCRSWRSANPGGVLRKGSDNKVGVRAEKKDAVLNMKICAAYCQLSS